MPSGDGDGGAAVAGADERGRRAPEDRSASLKVVWVDRWACLKMRYDGAHPVAFAVTVISTTVSSATEPAATKRLDVDRTRVSLQLQ